MMTEEQKQALIHELESRRAIMRIDSDKLWEYDWFADEAYRIALAALTQPASPALKLPDGWVAVPLEPTEEMIAAGDQFMDGLSRLGDAYDAMLEASPTVPHTAPTEPICATGGAEWVKCSERMPLELSDEHISEVEFIVTDGKTVGTCECRRGYMPCPWVEWSNYGDIDADKITHWMPLPAAPKP